MLLLSPVAARLIAAWGGGRVLALAGVVIATGLAFRILAVDALYQVVVGSAIVGAGTGIGYAALPSLTAYRVLFGICAGVSVLAAVAGLLVSSSAVAGRARGAQRVDAERVSA